MFKTASHKLDCAGQLRFSLQDDVQHQMLRQTMLLQMVGFSASNGWLAEDSGSHFVFTIKPNRHSCAEKIVGKIRCAYEPRREKMELQDFRPGLTQTGLYKHEGWLQAGNFGFRK